MADKLKDSGVIALYGELGSGKTTFVKGFLKGLGVHKRIVSPTFVFIREYRAHTNQHGHRHELTRRIYHVDLYRIEKPEDTRGLGLEEILSDPKNIIAIEWAEKIKDLLPKKRIDIFFKYVNETTRKVRLHTLT